jgi:hypothetical protein
MIGWNNLPYPLLYTTTTLYWVMRFRFQSDLKTLLLLYKYKYRTTYYKSLLLPLFRIWMYPILCFRYIYITYSDFITSSSKLPQTHRVCHWGQFHKTSSNVRSSKGTEGIFLCFFYHILLVFSTLYVLFFTMFLKKHKNIISPVYKCKMWFLNSVIKI